MPKLSVLLLCWNHAAYLEQCIGALQRQSSQDFEILFLDNGSSDGSVELAARLLKCFGSRFTLLQNEEPRSISANFNRLFRASSGELVAPLSTDDWYADDYVEAMLAAAAKHPQAGWFYPGGWYYHDEEQLLEEVKQDDFKSGYILDALLNGDTPFFFVGCCYRRDAINRVGGWDDAQPIEDRDLFIRLARHYPVQQVQKDLVYYRRSSSAVSANPAFMVAGWEAFFAKHAELFGSSLKSQLANMYGSYAALAIDQGRLKAARRFLFLALMASPSRSATYRSSLYLLRSSLRAGLTRIQSRSHG